MMKTNQADVVVVGGGVASLSTVAELLDAGKKLVLLDRDEPARFGGMAKASFGGVFIVGSPEQKRSKIKDNEELAFQDWCNFGSFGANDDLPKAWARDYVQRSAKDIHEWLGRRNVKFFPVVHWVERGLFEPGNSVPRFHMVWGTGKGLVDGLVDSINRHPLRHNLTLRFFHEVKDIQKSGGRFLVSGFDHRGNTDFEFSGDQVIVGTGGICGNLDLVRKNWYAKWGAPPKTLLNGSHRYALGKMHTQLEKLGGQITHLDKQWNYAAGVHHPRPDKELDGLSLVPPKSALWMNYQGKRIGPVPLMTAFDTRYLVEQICQQEKKYSWQIMNKKIAQKELAVSGAEYNDAIRDKNIVGFLKTVLLGNKKLVNDLVENCQDFVVANSVRELAGKMNELTGSNDVDPELLEREIGHYDSMIDRKLFNDDQLRRIAHVRRYKGDRVRTCKFQKIVDSRAMPLIAVREFILTRKSLGGVQTDLESRVLDQSGQPIDGLYAVGETAGFGGGGIHGLRALEGTFLGSCILTGQSAARSIAQ